MPLDSSFGSLGRAVGAGSAGMGLDLVGSAIGGGISLGYDLIRMKKQNQYNVKNWQMQNEYNSPSAQMERLAQAGLNPNLIYGAGAQGASGNAQQIAPTSGGAGTLPKFDMGTISQIMLQESARKSNDALAAKNLADAELSRQKVMTEPYMRESILSTIKVQDKTILKMAAEIGLISEQTATELTKQSLNKSSEDLNRSHIDLNSSQQNLNAALARKADADAKLASGQYDNLQYQKDLLIAQAALFNKHASYLEALETMTAVQTKISQIELWMSKQTSSKSVEALNKELEVKVKALAASEGIIGSDAVQWTQLLIGLIRDGASAFGSIGSGYRGFRGGYSPVYNYNLTY